MTEQLEALLAFWQQEIKNNTEAEDHMRRQSEVFARAADDARRRADAIILTMKALTEMKMMERE